MFKRLQQKWKVGPLQIVLIIICFAIGGSVTAFAAKKIMNLLSIRQDWLWAIVYILFVTLIWPIAVVVISVFFGQLKFFVGYVRRLGRKLGVVSSRQLAVGSGQSAVGSRQSALGSHARPANVAIFASGAGSNAQKIIEHFRNSSMVKVALVVCNKPGAGVVKIAEGNNIPFLNIEKQRFFSGDAYLDELRAKEIDFIVLAGFLWKIPDQIIKAYPRRIVNIHPALLPKYGGKGMYGNHVHEAVLAAGEKESGITIHYVDEHYDNGDIILQVRCPVLENDDPQSLAHRIHILEHANYPVIIEELVNKLVK